MPNNSRWSVVIPLSNEEKTVHELAKRLELVMNQLGDGVAYFVIDQSSKDETLSATRLISENDLRFQVLWKPEVSNVVEAYLAGFAHAIGEGHEIIIEMDGGLAHDPSSIPSFLAEFADDTDCVFGSRFCEGGELVNANKTRVFLSKGGTFLANFLLGTSMTDMTSGFQAFRRHVLAELLRHPLKSTGHFYQTEVRYLLRDFARKEVAIKYQGDGKNVGTRSLRNAFFTLCHYFFHKIQGSPLRVGRRRSGQSGTI